MTRFLLALFLFVAALPAKATIELNEVTSDGGITAWYLEDHSLPFVALELQFRGGASLDAPGKRGAINLMTALLEEGAGDMDARAFATAKEELAASFSYDVSQDMLSISARFLTENRDQSIALLRETLINPRFDQDAIERVRAQVLSIIASDEKDPGEINRTAFAELVYGDHPYASNLNGTAQSVAALTREDLQTAHRATLVRDQLYVSAVGDITAAQLSELLDELLGELPQSGPELPNDASLNLPGGAQVIDYDTPQSVATFSQVGIARDDPDFFAAYLLNHILGGGSFESRLMREVREKRGLTYGIYSYLLDRDGADLWVGSVSSANDRIADAIDVIRAEWDRIRTEGITQEELDDAITYQTGAYPLQFDSNGAIAKIAVGMQRIGLPRDYIKNRNAQMSAVTLDDINRVAKELLDPDQLTFVVVGKPEGLENTID